MRGIDRGKLQAPVLEVKEIPMDKLVPGELVLEEDVVDRVKAAIKNGDEIERPRVTPIGAVYYVRDGNHRIMAMKQLGHASVSCRIQPYHSPKGSADHDTDMCNKALAEGHLGFDGVTLGSKAEKERAYDEEDDLFEDIK